MMAGSALNLPFFLTGLCEVKLTACKVEVFKKRLSTIFGYSV